MDMTKILGRVRKLLAIANDTRANPNEAAAAAAQAENIMRKFNLDNADVLLKEAAAGTAEFDTANVSAYMKRDVPNNHVQKRTPKWAGWLAIRVAKLNDCEVRIVWDKVRGSVIQFCGYVADIQVAAWMYDYLLNCMIGSVRAWQREARRSAHESNSYREAFVLALCEKLRTLQREREAAMRAGGASSGALIVAKANAVAQHFGGFKYGASRTISNRDAAAAYAGHTAGQAVDVARRAVRGTSGPAPLMLGN